MKILFIAPRYHTNQLPIVRELLRRGIDVDYAVHYRGSTEDYRDLTPILLKKSFFLHCKIFLNRIAKKHHNEEYYGMHHNASFINIIHVIRKSKPDLIVLRGKAKTERKACIASFFCGVPAVLYNQEPLYKPEIKSKAKRFLKKIYNWFVPNTRYTPVKVSDYNALKKIDTLNIPPHTYFVPFAGEMIEEAKGRTYLANNRINFLMVGKYREYKNHKVLIDALDMLEKRSGYILTLVGQCNDEKEKNYFENLKKYIESKRLTPQIRFVTNVEPDQMKDYYLNNDVLILPTKHEAASISVLEAMHHGMSVISTSRNGTASYIDYGKTGYIFTTCDAQDLKEKLMMYIKNPESVEKMGRYALTRAQSDYSQEAYFSSFVNMLEKEFPKVFEKLNL